MIIQRAFKALWQGIVSPEDVPKAGTETALALFALAVFLLAGISTISAYVEDSSPALKAESEILSQYGMAPPAQEGEDVEVVSTPNQVFISVFGGALMMSLGKIGVLAGVMMVLGRFMTNAQTSYTIALASVSSTALIDVLKGAVTIPLHLTTGTVRAGFHAGVFVSPTEAPFLFTFLQRIDVFAIWQYIAIGMVMAVWSGLHKKYGIAIGTTVFVVVSLFFAAITLLSWFTSQSV